MNEVVDFASCHIDPAPLQIMEGTPLSNVSPIHIVKYPTLFAIFNRMLPLSLSICSDPQPILAPESPGCLRHVTGKIDWSRLPQRPEESD